MKTYFYFIFTQQINSYSVEVHKCVLIKVTIKITYLYLPLYLEEYSIRIF